MADPADRARPPVLRPVRDADRAFLLRLYTGGRGDLAALPLPEPARRQMIEMQFEAQAQGYARQFPRASHDIVVLDGCALGQIRVDRSGAVVQAIDLSLLPEARGQGIGTRLLTGLQEEASVTGRVLRLSVLHGNPAERLYRRLGFTARGDTGTHLEMQWCAGRTTPS